MLHTVQERPVTNRLNKRTFNHLHRRQEITEVYEKEKKMARDKRMKNSMKKKKKELERELKNKKGRRDGMGRSGVASYHHYAPPQDVYTSFHTQPPQGQAYFHQNLHHYKF